MGEGDLAGGGRERGGEREAESRKETSSGLFKWLGVL